MMNRFDFGGKVPLQVKWLIACLRESLQQLDIFGVTLEDFGR